MTSNSKLVNSSGFPNYSWWHFPVIYSSVVHMISRTGWYEGWGCECIVVKGEGRLCKQILLNFEKSWLNRFLTDDGRGYQHVEVGLVPPPLLYARHCVIYTLQNVSSAVLRCSRRIRTVHLIFLQNFCQAPPLPCTHPTRPTPPNPQLITKSYETLPDLDL